MTKTPLPPRSSTEDLPRPLLVTPTDFDDPSSPRYVRGAYFDQDAVDRVVAFFALLRHTIGRWRGTKFDLLAWQVAWIIAPVFGWKNADGTRIIRTVWIDVPRKNGKSSLGSGLALYLLSADREGGAEVYAAAGDRQQARIVFGAAKAMASASTPLRKKLRPLRDVIMAPGTGSMFRVLSSDARLSHGLNVHGAVIDEVHVHKNRDLIDALETGTGSRDQPLIVFVTTANDGDEYSIYAEKRGYIEKLVAGHVVDPTTYGVVFGAADTDDALDPATLPNGNPGYGVTVKAEYLLKEQAKAAATPSYYNTFCRLHLNRATKQTTAWLDLRKWDATAGLVVAEQVRGRKCYGGLDLSSTQDLTALLLVHPDDADDERGYDVMSYFWLPEDTLAHRMERDRMPWDQWAKAGLVRLTEGNVVDYRVIRSDLRRLRDEGYKIAEIGYDPWNATETVQELQDDGFTMVPVRQGYASLSPPSKELERLVMSGRWRHGGNPVLRWNADCVEVRRDNEGNIKPVKPDAMKSTKRVDGIVAGIMGLDRAMRHESKKPGTFYMLA